MTGPDAPRIVLEARGVSKSFGAHAALDGVDFALRAGQIHALLGENGAGKSTLIKILTGVYHPDVGQVLMKGARVDFRDPQHAQEHGIGTVYQEVNLLPNRSVADNLMLGRQPRRFGLVNRSQTEAIARDLLARYGLSVDVRAELGGFSVAVQQIVAIARAVELSGKVLILDEPTASLDRPEVDRLFGVLRTLRDQGLAIVFITHYLEQAFAIADHATILRNGRVVGAQDLRQTSQSDLVRMILGKDIAFGEAPFAAGERPTGEAVASFDGFGHNGHLRPFSMEIHAGEVIGVAGLLGSGRTEMARMIFGVDPHDAGSVRVAGKPVTVQSPLDAIRLGWGFCPEDRKADGIFGDLSVRENIIIALQGKLGMFRTLNREEQHDIAGRFAEALDIRAASPDMAVRLLSGGNQQKVILARWLATDPTLLILDEPTRGIDIGAHAEIVRCINRLREDGLALIVISSELDEVVAYSSRVAVMRDRALVRELRGADISPDMIVREIATQSGSAP
ncbi:MAG: sugar ABC transporter ATP-binding protein [Pseudomonadota bacterium]